MFHCFKESIYHNTLVLPRTKEISKYFEISSINFLAFIFKIKIIYIYHNRIKTEICNNYELKISFLTLSSENSQFRPIKNPSSHLKTTVFSQSLQTNEFRKDNLVNMNCSG